MAYVHTSFCPDVERHCLDMEHEETNHLEICHAFAHEQRCRTDEHDIAFCADRYEYPNKKGGHLVWMLDWYQAQATCESKGKRLCSAPLEWTGRLRRPRPHAISLYGWERDHDKCNIDNFYIDPRKPAPWRSSSSTSKDPEIAFKELVRLDESVPSGSMETCKSGFGVYDMPGNVDEWVINDGPPHEKSKFAGLKGGGLGPRPQPVPARDVQPRAGVLLLLRGLPLLPGPRGRCGARVAMGSLPPGRSPAHGRAARFRAGSHRRGSGATGPSKTKYLGQGTASSAGVTRMGDGGPPRVAAESKTIGDRVRSAEDDDQDARGLRRFATADRAAGSWPAAPRRRWWTVATSRRSTTTSTRTCGATGVNGQATARTSSRSWARPTGPAAWRTTGTGRRPIATTCRWARTAGHVVGHRR